MNKLFLPLIFSISLLPALLAADEKPAPQRAAKTRPADVAPPAEEKTKTPEEPGVITHKNKSSFQADVDARNPFWPIGWKPRARIGGAGDAEGEVPASAFLVTSITLETATHFAIINGKTMGEGQQFGLQIGTQIYQVTVKRIEDGKVILGRRDEEIVVPLRRK